MRIFATETFIGLCAAAALALSGAGKTHAADIIVGAGDAAPIHFHVGRAVCRSLEKTIQGLSCEVRKITGRDEAEPRAVLNNVRNGAIEIGLAQSDWIHNAVTGQGDFKFADGQFTSLRTLFVLHGEPFTVIARRDSGIKTIDDLAGKRVNIGGPGTKERAVMEMVMAAQGWTYKSFQMADEMAQSEQLLALCHNRIQAMVATVAHPDPNITKVIKLCDAAPVAITGPNIDKLVGAHPYFAKTSVPGGFYQGQGQAVPTFGVRVGVVASEDIDDDIAYAVTKAVAGNLSRFQRLHPALGQLTTEDLIRDGVNAPLHKGAARYFRENGMM